jgi:Fe-S-cluster containining protein
MLDHPIGHLECCQACDGECCRSFPTVNITLSEYNRLLTLGANRLYFSLSGRHKLIIENGCEFQTDGRCSIYNDRPDICRRFICVDAVKQVPPRRFWSGDVRHRRRNPKGSPVPPLGG